MRKKDALLVQLKHLCTYLYCANGQTISSQFLSILKPDGEFLTAGVYISSLEIVIWVWWLLSLLWYYGLNNYTPLSLTGTVRQNEIMKTPPLLRNLKGAQSPVQSVCPSTSSHTRVQHSSPGDKIYHRSREQLHMTSKYGADGASQPLGLRASHFLFFIKY